MNFKELCNTIQHSACVVSVEKTEDGYGEIRIVDGNDVYLRSFQTDFATPLEFVPNSIYTKYLAKNLNFEDYSYRSAVKKELLHSYAYPEYFKAWMHMLFIPLAYETEKLSYCLYIMEINNEFNPELLAHPRGDIYSKVLNTTLQLTQGNDFDASMNNVMREVRKICNATFCCILLADPVKDTLEVLAEDRDPKSNRKPMKEYMDERFRQAVKTWDSVIAKNGNCVIINSKKGMDYIKEIASLWHETLVEDNVQSLVLFPIKSENSRLGYMWVSDFKVDDTTQIKEALEITTFVLGAQIANHLLLDQLTKLSSVDILTGLFNRTKLNSYMNGMQESSRTPISLIFLDINGLKKINDFEGHLAGDDLIRRAAKALNSTFEGRDIFRVGGDEFVVIMKNVSEDAVQEYIEKLRQNAAKLDVSFSAGYSITDDPKCIEETLKEADMNMYNDKRKFYNK